MSAAYIEKIRRSYQERWIMVETKLKFIVFREVALNLFTWDWTGNNQHSRL